MTERPPASAALAARSTSIAIKGGTRPRRDGPEAISVFSKSGGPIAAAAVGLQHSPGRGGVAQQPLGRADRAPHQLAVAVRASAAKHSLAAIAAECALVGADSRLSTVGRQVAIAAFAVGAQFEHRGTRKEWSERRHPAGEGC